MQPKNPGHWLEVADGRFTCPGCGTVLAAPEEYAGRVSRCKCGKTLTVPKPPANKTGPHGFTLVVDDAAPNAPHQPAAPKDKADKTALGQVVAHTPTNLKPQPGAGHAATPRKPGVPGRPDKTALGQAVAHAPTVLKPGPAAPSSHTRQLRAGQAGPAPASRGPLVFVVVLLVLLCGSVFTVGLFWFLSSQKKPDSPEQVLAKGPEVPGTGASPKAGELPPAKQNQKPAATGDGATPPPKEQPAQKDKNAAPAAEPPVQPPPKASIPAGLAPLIGKLESGTPEEQVRAAEDLANRGEKAGAAARALCAAAVSPTKEVSRSALQALEKVAPELYEPVFTLVVDGQAANHRKAIATLRQQGTKAKPAVPVLLFQMRKCEADLKQQVEGRFGRGGWGSNTLVDVITDQMIALPQIAPEDPEVLQAIIGSTNTVFQRQIFVSKRALTTTPFRSTGIRLLGELAAKRPEHRKLIVPELVELLDESVGHVNGTNNGQRPGRKVRPGFPNVNLLTGLAEVESVSFALMRCGPDAKDTLAKKVIPQLKDLEFHKDASVRNAAKSLRQRIEAGPAALQGSYLGDGRFERQDQLTLADPRDRVRQRSVAKEYSVHLKAGKTYQIDMVSAAIDSYLRLEDAAGQQLAFDDDGGGFPNARILFPCRQTGTYRVICTTFQGGATGLYTLTIQER